MRTQHNFIPQNLAQFKEQLLCWAQQFEDVVWLETNNHNDEYSNYDAVLAVDAFTSLTTDYSKAFDELKTYQSATNDWLFGYLTYDLKNGIEHLKSNNFDGLAFPDLHFFQPKKMFFIKNNTIEMRYLKMVDDEIEKDLKSIAAVTSSAVEKSTMIPSCQADQNERLNQESRKTNPIKIKLRTQKDDYFKKVNQMLAHIKRGDIYEANFCQEFYAENTAINPLVTFLKLNAISKPPFATFLKLKDRYLLSASPERYLKKEGQTIISQPIKGTAKRSSNTSEDKGLALALATDQKERSENIMIVDLVRNDLSKTAKKGSVKVKELCKVYSFMQVHQMISTVVSKIDKTVHPVDVIKTTFPMGSMTGAPKISAMGIIENLEDAKRGLYSGAVGYFSPEGNFDFNVIIRSILYNAKSNYVSYSVGSAITAKSQPKNEYEECLIKAKAMREVLESPFNSLKGKINNL